MLRIERYILRQLVFSMVLVTTGLIVILWLTQSLRFIELTVNKGASLIDFLRLTVLMLPNFLTIILPVSLFAVVLFTYNKLLADRELVALRAAGMSHWHLARPALYVAGICTFLGFIFNLWLIPLSVAGFHQMQWSIRSNAMAVLLQDGAFNDIGNGLTIYVRGRNENGELLGLIVNDARNPMRPVTLMAERGALIMSQNGPPKVLLIRGTRQEVTRGSEHLSLLYFDNYTMEFSINTGPAMGASSDPREQPTDKLFEATPASVGAQLYRQYQVELHQRIAAPLYHFVFALLACACLLAGHFNRRGQVDRIAIGVGLMVAIQALGLGISDVATNKLALLPLIYACPILTCAAAAWVLLRGGWSERPRGALAG